MWLEAIMTHEDLVQVLGGFLPVKIYLDPEEEREKEKGDRDRWLLLKPATNVDLVSDEGLRVTCDAELSWSIVGLNPTVKIDALRVLLRPEVAEKHKGHVLQFALQVEAADFHGLPDLIDSTIVKAVNGALDAKRLLAWNFTETLTRTLALGEVLDPVEALRIGVVGSKLRVSAEG